VKTTSNDWVEFKSLENVYGPQLTFSYHTPADTTTKTYDYRSAKDSYRITGDQAAVTDNVWQLKDIRSQRMFLQFLLPLSLPLLR